jgi:hypothetical protein
MSVCETTRCAAAHNSRTNGNARSLRTNAWQVQGMRVCASIHQAHHDTRHKAAISNPHHAHKPKPTPSLHAVVQPEQILTPQK